MWDGDGRLSRGTGFSGGGDDGLRVPEHHLGQLSQQNRQRASSGATTRMNSSPSTTRPGTQSPSQPQRDLPGVRNFSLFGGVYTWKKAQEDKDLKDPNFNGGAGKGGLRGYVAPAGKPAFTPEAADAAYAENIAGQQDEDLTSINYDDTNAELRGVRAGSKFLEGTAAEARAMLDRTGKPIELGPYEGGGRGVVMSGRGVGALFGGGEVKSTTVDRYYVPAGDTRLVDGGVSVDMVGGGVGSGRKGISLLYGTDGKGIGAGAPSAGTFKFGEGITYKPPEGFNEIGNNSRPVALANAKKAGDVFRKSDAAFKQKLYDLGTQIKADPSSLSRTSEGWRGIESPPVLSGDYLESKKSGVRAKAPATVDLWEQLGSLSLARPKRR